MEKFISIKDYESRYKINVNGLVKSIPIRVNCRGGKTRLTKEKDISTFRTSHGYLAVGLTNGNEVKRQYLHRLIYSHFVSDIPEGMVINHIDGNPSNNSINNLEVVSQRDNVRHYFNSKKRNVGVRLDNPQRGKRKYRASIWDGKQINLGRHDKEEDAVKAVNDYIEKNFNNIIYN